MMTVPPLVSIGITTYKRPLLLLETITSIQRQTFQNFEIVICDDNSQDDTKDVIESIGDPRIRYYCNERNLGQIKNVNRCIQLSTGKYFCWNSDDNIYLPYFLEKLVDALETHTEVGAAVCSTIVADYDLKPYCEQRVVSNVTLDPAGTALITLLGDGYNNLRYNPSSVLYHRALVLRDGMLNEDIWNDWAWVGRYVYHYGCVRIPEALFVYRDHAQSLGKSMRKFDKNLDPVEIMYQNYQEIFKEVSKDEKVLWALRTKIYRQLACYAILSCIGNMVKGRFQLAQKQIREALQIHPFAPIDPYMVATILKWFQERRDGGRMLKAKQAATFKSPVWTP